MNARSETITFLNKLVAMGFDENAFQRLHHMGSHSTEYTSKTSIKNHIDYCAKGASFQQGSTNEDVFLRLRFVYNTYTAMNIANDNLRVFRALADAAYFGIRSNTSP
jgi:hypothetical protein